MQQLLYLFDAKLMSVDEMAASTPAVIQSRIDQNEDSVGGALHGTAVKLKALGGKMPSTREELVNAAGLEDVLARFVMQGVFGCTELVISLDIRKVVCALDLIDWEEGGATKKDEIKMIKIPGGHVQKSLCVWMPAGHRRTYQDVMDAMGDALGSCRVGFWGSLTRIINRHFSPKDEKLLEDMTTSIVQFCKVTRKGGRRKNAC